MNSTRFDNDKALWIGVTNNDREAFAAIFDKYYRSLVIFCGGWINNLHICEDIVQDIFVKLWISRHDIDISYLRLFLLRACRNACLNHLRHQGIRNNYETYSRRILSNSATSLDGYILYADLEGHLNEILERMPAAQREVFVENRLNGRSCSDIAREHNISHRTVEERLRRALKTLRELLSDFKNETK